MRGGAAGLRGLLEHPNNSSAARKAQRPAHGSKDNNALRFPLARRPSAW
jgi:hypothetical protein